MKGWYLKGSWEQKKDGEFLRKKVGQNKTVFHWGGGG